MGHSSCCCGNRHRLRSAISRVRQSRSGSMLSCPIPVLSGSICWVRPRIALWSIWNCKAAMIRRWPSRMAEYALGIYRLFERFPQQFCLYVGEPPLRMPDRLRGPGFAVEYTLIDVRSLDGNDLLESEEIGDNLIAILTRLRDHKDAIRQIVVRVRGLAEGAREEALVQLYTLAGLRRMVPLVRKEIEAMPVYIDLRENEVLGPPYIRGLEEGGA